MNILEAKQVLQEMAKGKYHSLEIGINHHPKSAPVVNYKVYIGDVHGGTFGYGDGWESALEDLRRKITPRKESAPLEDTDVLNDEELAKEVIQ